MKAPFPLTILTLCIPCHVPADVSNQTQLGIEAVTGYRSGYIYRGFELSESTIDIQIETEINLSNDTSLGMGTWYAAENGGGDYDEYAFFSQLKHQYSDQLTIGLRASYRDFNHSNSPLSVAFEDGVDLGTFASWKFNNDLTATAGAYYDVGADAWYANAETEWSKAISEKTFISLITGLSYVNDYYERNGMNDAYGRLSLTHHISDTVSITPFVGGSILIDDDDEGDDQSFAGLWFEVRF